VPTSTDRSGFIAECRTGKFEGVQTIYRTFDSFAATGRIDAELIEVLPRSLKFICHNGEKLRSGRPESWAPGPAFQVPTDSS
jgi:glyoxylate reductase